MHRRRPQLKNGVDLQLQTAFFDGNWPTAIRLADKRSKALKDQYYEVVKVVCEGQLDDPVTKLATVNAVKQYLKDGTVVKDADGLDLLEWATQAFFTDDDYLETLGPLRVRAVKAFPKDKISGAKNLESCLMHWDLTSAQQIAAIMDKSFPNEKKFLFWNIAITHMLSGSLQSPADKKKLYGMLAQKQIERAAQAAEQAVSGDTKPPARSVQSEEEILLLYAIVEKHGSPADYDKLVNSPLFNPNEQFRRGRKELFLRVIAKYSKESRWAEVYDICKKSLSETDSDGKLSLLASDWMVWQHFIKAAGHLQTTDDSAAKSLQELLLKLIKSPGLRPIYRKNLLLARVAAVFELSLTDGADRSEGGDSSTRLQELTQYIKDQKGSPTCFEDVKSFVERLDRSGMNYLAYELLPHLHEGVDVLQDADYTRVAALKMQYFILSCPLMYDTVAGEKPRYKCQACSQECDFEACEPCIADISRRALAFHSETLGRNPDKSFNARTNDSSRFEGDAPSQLLILAALCSIKLANPDKHGSCVGLPADSIRHLVHAVSLLEYGRLALPKYSDYLLLLFQLHLVLGTGPNAADHWDNLAVKRTIVDSLGPLFYDRLSAVSPGMCSMDDDGNEPLDVLNSHYIPSLQLRMPRKLIDAFQNDSYGSVIGIPEYMEKLRYSCTRAMGFVEEAKVERTTGYSLDDFMIDSRFAELTSPTKLNEVVDYGSFPSLECSTNPPVWARLRLGPPPTDTRCRLAIYAEAFYNVLMYKPPSTYKVAPGKADHAFVVEKLCQISSQMGCIKRGPGDGSTAEERIHFEVITILSTLIPLCVDSGREPEAVEAAGPMCEAVKSALDALEGRIPALGGMDVPEVVRFCGSMQPVAALRDVASAARISADWILHFAEKEKERDRSGQSNLPKELVAHVKDLQAAAAAALKRGREMVDAAAAKAKSGPFMVKVGAEWAFAGAGCGHIRETTEEYSGAASLAVGWAKNLQGWQEVTWE